MDIENIGGALKKYYSKNRQMPNDLEILVSSGFLPSIPLDPVTKKAPAYYRSDEQYSCRVESQLSDGSFVRAYCK